MRTTELWEYLRDPYSLVGSPSGGRMPHSPDMKTLRFSCSLLQVAYTVLQWMGNSNLLISTWVTLIYSEPAFHLSLKKRGCLRHPVKNMLKISQLKLFWRNWHLWKWTNSTSSCLFSCNRGEINCKWIDSKLLFEEDPRHVKRP